MRIVERAPSSLIAVFEHRLKTDGSEIDGVFVPLNQYRPPWRNRKQLYPLRPIEILEELLTNSKMRLVWKSLGRYMNCDEHYLNFYDAIMEAMRVASHGVINQSARQAWFRDTAKMAERLLKRIAEPQNKKGRLYRGELDVSIYNLFPSDIVNKLGAQSWETMKPDQRTAWALSVLWMWPTIVDVLNELAVQARKLANRPANSERRRRPGKASDESEANKDHDIKMKTNASLFASAMCKYMFSMDIEFHNFSAIGTVTSIIYGVPIDRKAIAKAARISQVRNIQRTEERQPKGMAE